MPRAATLKVLVVDDQLTMREVAKMALQEMGVRHILDAENGTDAFKKATTQPLDMIISDYNMPEMDGLACYERFADTPPCASFRSSWSRVAGTTRLSSRRRKRGLTIT